MDRAEARFAWHLKRGQKIYGSISHRELRLLAELGHLRPDDLYEPDRSFVKEAQPNAATLKRIAKRPTGRDSKSMQFGIIGYNYNPQH